MSIPSPSLMELADLITIRHKFISCIKLKRIVQDAQNSPTGQNPLYILFTDVPPNEITRLTRQEALPLIRFTTNSATGLVIAKIPDRAHEFLSCGFTLLFVNHIIAMGITLPGILNPPWPMGSTTVTFGNWTKEAEASWSYFAQGPTHVVIEVGYLENERELTLEAQGWIEPSQSAVQIVYTLAIHRTLPQLVIKEWRRSAVDPQFPNSRVHAVQAKEIIIDHDRLNNISRASGPLQIPLLDVIGRAPNPQSLETDIDIPQQHLVLIAERVWGAQGLI